MQDIIKEASTCISRLVGMCEVATARAEVAEKERDELAEAVHAAMERFSSHEKKQSISQLVADIAYLKRLAKEHYAERDRMREALSIIADNHDKLTSADCADIARGILRD